MSWFEHSGARIYFEERGAGDPVLVTPGFTQGIDELEVIINALAARYWVIAADMPGSGQSGPQPRAYTPEFYQEDAARMAALLVHLDASPAHLVAFSDGGEVALLVAAQDATLARSLVVWGVAGTLDVGNIEPVIDSIYTVMDRPVEGASGWGDYLKDIYGEDAARAMTRSWAEASRAILAGGGEISLSQVGEIRCPVLIIGGEYDPFSPPEAASELARRIPNAELMIAPGVGHAVHDDEPEWFEQTVLDWLARQ